MIIQIDHAKEALTKEMMSGFLSPAVLEINKIRKDLENKDYVLFGLPLEVLPFVLQTASLAQIVETTLLATGLVGSHTINQDLDAWQDLAQDYT